MHIFFSGIGGTGIGPLALIAAQAGFTVSGSDKQNSAYVSYLKKHGVTNIYIGQTRSALQELHAKTPIDWFVYSSALPKENPNHPELAYAEQAHIKHSKRDEFLNYLLDKKSLKLLAVSGTHGKTTTTAMLVWLFKQLQMPVSYSVGAKLSFGDMGHYDPKSEYFAYECDEYDRNFLSFKPYVSLITGIDWDHADVFPTRQNYYDAFKEFIVRSEGVLMWQDDFDRIGQTPLSSILALDQTSLPKNLTLAGHVNRLDAWLVIQTVHELTNIGIDELTAHMNSFPGVSRRFEAITDGLYSDYAHTPKKIEGALQLAHEVAGNNVVVIYEGLHNTRQHFIKSDLEHLFDSVKKLYVVPSYLAREDPSLKLLSPHDIITLTSKPSSAQAVELNKDLRHIIQKHLSDGDLVLALSAGGGGSLDEWLRAEFTYQPNSL